MPASFCPGTGPRLARRLLVWQLSLVGREASGQAKQPGSVSWMAFVLSGLSPSYRPGRAPAGSWDASNQAGLPTAAGQPAFNPAGPPGPASWLLTWQDLPGRPGVFWPGRACSASWPACQPAMGPAGSLDGFFPGRSPWLAAYWPGRASQAGWDASGLAGLPSQVPGRSPPTGTEALGLAGLPGPA